MNEETKWLLDVVLFLIKIVLIVAAGLIGVPAAVMILGRAARFLTDAFLAGWHL